MGWAAWQQRYVFGWRDGAWRSRSFRCSIGKKHYPLSSRAQRNDQGPKL